MDNAQAQAHYGNDAAEWLSRWDNDETVWSVEMGGLGPGYEQAIQIQITIAEIIRFMLAENFDHTKWGDKEKWEIDRARIEKMGLEEGGKIRDLGLSGAQWGAALQVATHIYMRDPWVAFMDEKIKDRLIQVSRSFPDG